MRRCEGYEVTVSNPEPVLNTVGGVSTSHEPMELLVCDLPDDAVRGVTETRSSVRTACEP